MRKVRRTRPITWENEAIQEVGTRDWNGLKIKVGMEDVKTTIDQS